MPVNFFKLGPHFGWLNLKLSEQDELSGGAVNKKVGPPFVAHSASTQAKGIVSN